MGRIAAGSVGFVLAVLTATVAAEALPRDDLERRCWLQHTRERTRVSYTEPTAVDVANLADGYALRSPLRVDFSIRGMGVIPAGKPHPKAGHHHVLVDTDLPLNPADKIPFSDFHRHFGKGQTGATIALPPGPHRLRLLFADHDHRPYFVFSPEIRFTVTGPRTGEPLRIDGARFEATCKAWYQDEMTRPRPEGKRVAFANLRDGEPVVSPINVRLAADGLGIAPRGHGGAEAGHFVLEVQAPGKAVQTVDLASGATQTNLFLALGAHQLRLRLYDDSRSRELLPPAEISIVVVGQDRS